MANLNDERAKFLADLMGMGEDESISPEVAKEAAEMPATPTVTVEMTDEDRGGTYTETMPQSEYNERFGQPEVKKNTVTVSDCDEFEVSGITFKYYRGTLWADGGDFDDWSIRDIEMPDEVDEIDIEITASDIEEAENYLDQIRDDNGGVLLEVMTAGEVAQVYKLAEATVRQSINRGTLPARKSGGTWLVRRKDAEARWGKKL